MEADAVPITAVRAHRCPGCDAPVADRSARWCGRCGERLVAAPVDDLRELRGPVRWRAVTVLAAAGSVVVGLVLSAGPIVEGLPRGDPLAVDSVVTPTTAALDRVVRRDLPPPAPVDGPVCTRAPGDRCLRWHLGDRRSSAAVAVAGSVVVLADPTGPRLWGIDATTGRQRWWQPSPGSNRQVAATDELVLTVEQWHRDPSAHQLVVRVAADGSLRFTRDGFAPAGWLAARQVADRLVVLSSDDPDGDAEERRLTILAVDARTGAEAWRATASGAGGIAPDGTTVVAEDGQLVARDIEGRERWRRPLEDGAPERGWISGDVVHVWLSGGEPVLYRLRDGEPYGFRGGVAAASGRHALVRAWEIGPGGGQTAQRLVLLRDGEPRWEVPYPNVCVSSARFLHGAVRVIDCDGVRTDLDVVDGRQLARSEPDPAFDAFADVVVVDPYLLRPESDDPGAAFVLVDTRTDHEVLRLPPGATAVHVDGADGWTADLGGLLLLQHNGGLTAIDLPGAPPRPGAMLRAAAR